PIAENECHILLVEPTGLVNTGDADDSDLTAPNDTWI
ncbi:MAG: cupin, partial [Anaerolineae bacterium]